MNNVKPARFIYASCLPLVLCICWLTGSGCDSKKETKTDSDRFTVLGKVMAGKTRELCKDKGRVVLVISENDRGNSTPFDLACEAFRNALGDTVQVVGTETVKTPKILMRGEDALTPERFSELLQKNPGADFLVSFIGVPLLTPQQIAQLSFPRPQVVEVVVLTPPTKAMLTGNVVCLAALFKVGSQPPTGGSTQELFDAQYQVVTPETTGLLPR